MPCPYLLVLAGLLLAIACTRPAPPARPVTPGTVVVVDGMQVYTLTPGETYESTLDAPSARLPDGTPGQVWRFTGTTGGCARIMLHSSTFDAFLYLRYQAPVGEVMDLDDNSLGGTDALISRRLPADGTYFVTATTAVPGGPRGPYTLQLTQPDTC